MATAQQLVDLANSLNGFAGAIEGFIAAQPNPFAANLVALRTTEARIASAASQVEELAIEVLAPEIAAAAADLSGKVVVAQGQLAQIQDVQKGLQIVATILSVAAAASSGDVFGTADGVTQLASELQAVL